MLHLKDPKEFIYIVAVAHIEDYVHVVSYEVKEFYKFRNKAMRHAERLHNELNETNEPVEEVSQGNFPIAYIIGDVHGSEFTSVSVEKRELVY